MKKSKKTKLVVGNQALRNGNCVSKVGSCFEMQMMTALSRPMSAKSVYDRLKASKPASSAAKKKTKTVLKKKKLSLAAGNVSPSVTGDSSAPQPPQDSLNDSAGPAGDCENEDDQVWEDVQDDVEAPAESELTDAGHTSVVYKTLESLEHVQLNETNFLVFVPYSTCFYFKGKLQIRVLSGTVEVLGHQAEEDPTNPFPVYSPRGYSLLCVRSVATKKTGTPTAVHEHLTSSGFHCDEALLKTRIAGSAILQLERYNNPMIQYTSRVFPINILSEESSAQRLTEQQKQLERLCSGLDVNIILRGSSFSARFYQEPDFWSEYADELLAKLQIRKEQQLRLLLCGGKGVGKSTMLRYLVNRLLRHHNGSVLVVDLDPGQPEFTPAGVVSATVVDAPLLGPNLSHKLCARMSFMIGDVDVTTSPDRYVKSVTQLMSWCATQPELLGLPMIINTMGFTTGVGFDLTVDVLRISRPTRVLQITSRSARRNFVQLLERDYVTQLRRGWLTSAQDFLSDYEFQFVYSAAEHDERSLEEWGFRPPQLRALSIMSYFGRLSTGARWTLTDAVPYEISWQRLHLCVCHESVPASLVPAAMNGSLVGLCHLDEACASSIACYKADGYPSILQELPVIPCYGYGIVRSVDYERRSFHLITCEPIDKLALVNCLVMGAVHVPESMLLDTPPALQDVGGGGRRQRVPYAVQAPTGTQPSCRPYRKYNPVFTLRGSKQV